jgi:hypothetical protein
VARGRFLSKSISTNARLAKVPGDAERLWHRILSNAYRDGRISSDREILENEICPALIIAAGWTWATISRAIAELVNAGLLEEGEGWYRIAKFSQHQLGLRMDREDPSPWESGTPQTAPKRPRHARGELAAPDDDQPPRQGLEVEVEGEVEEEVEGEVARARVASPVPEPPAARGRTTPPATSSGHEQGGKMVSGSAAGPLADVVRSVIENPPPLPPSALRDEGAILGEIQRIRRCFGAAVEQLGLLVIPKPVHDSILERAAEMGTCESFETEEALRAEFARTMRGLASKKLQVSVKSVLAHIGESWEDRPVGAAPPVGVRAEDLRAELEAIARESGANRGRRGVEVQSGG